MDELRKVPPVTLTLLSLTLLTSLGPLLKLVHPYYLLLWWPDVLSKWQLWRPLTSFFLCGLGSGGGIQVLFDLFMLGRNSLDLEVNHFYRGTADYVWALLLVGTGILATNYPLQSTVLFAPMLMALTYLWSRANPTASVSIFGLVTCPAHLLPYAYLVVDLARGGLPLAVQSSTGILSAHMYYVLTSSRNDNRRSIFATPQFLKDLLPDSVDPAHAPAPGTGSSSSNSAQGGRVMNTTWGGTVLTPRGRSLGSGGTPNWPQQGQGQGGSGGSGPRTISDALGGRSPSSSASTGSSWTSWLTGRRTAQGSQPTGDSAAATLLAQQRQARLEATERRLRAQREDSIAGRNAAAASAAAPTTTLSQPRIGSTGVSGTSGTGTGANIASLNSSIRARSGAGGADEDKEEGRLDASSSGGAVMVDHGPAKADKGEEKKGE